MKELNKKHLEQMDKKMQSYKQTSPVEYIELDVNGNLIYPNVPTGNETLILINKYNPETHESGVTITIPAGMKCEKKTGPDRNRNEASWLIFNNSKSENKKIYDTELRFFQNLAKETDVEWALATTENSGGGKLFTSFDHSGVNPSPAYSGGYDILIHNHTGRVHDSTGYPLPLDQGDYENLCDLKREYDYKGIAIYSEEEKDYAYYK